MFREALKENGTLEGLSGILSDHETSRFFENAKVVEVNVYRKSRRIEFIVLFNTLIPAQFITKLEDCFAQAFQVDSFVITPRFNVSLSLQEILNDYWESIEHLVNKKIALSKGILSGSRWLLSGKKLVVKLKTRGSDILRSQGCHNIIEEVIKNSFSISIKVDFIDPDDDEESIERYFKFKENEENKVSKVIELIQEDSCKDSANISENKKQVKNKAGRKTEKSINESVILGKKIDDAVMKMNEVTQDSGTVVVVGDVFSVSFKEVRGGKILCSFDMTDYTSSLTVKFFAKGKKIEPVKERIKENITVKVRGEAQYDKFARELIILASDVMEIEKQVKTDTAEEKRVELHLHTQMSSMDGVTPLKDLMERAAFWGHKAIAVTDHGVVQAYPDAYKYAKHYNIKVIYGIECYLIENECPEDAKNNHAYHAIILVKNQAGLKNLYRLVSDSHIKYYYKRPRMPKDLLLKYRDGLLLGSACESGELFSSIVDKKSDEELLKIIEFYDYLEIQPLGNNRFLVESGKISSMDELKDINRKIVSLGKRAGKPVVATCDVHFMNPEDEIFRRILMAGQGYDDADKQPPLYFRTTQEMLKEFEYLGSDTAYEIVVANTNKITDMVEEVIPVPVGTFPPKIKGSEEEIKILTENRAKEIYGDPLPEIVAQRINKELDSIIKNGFAVMYIITQKLVARSLKDGYLVGSRGSVGSSLVAFMLGITEVNSLKPHYICKSCKYSEFFTDGSVDCGFDLPDKKCPNCGEILKKDGYDIPFETFLGFEGDKEPDIDLNFSGEYQQAAHKYVEELFGKNHVFRAGTISTVADKTAYGFVKNYLDERNIIATNAEINRLVRGCTGIKRTTGQHPGGIMIIPQDKEVFDFSPVQHPAGDAESGVITTHFDYHFLHGSILKLDILGHDDPTVIKMLEDLTGINAREIPMGESKTMGIFSSTEPLGVKAEDIGSEVGTLGIPEFGTKFVRQMLVDTRPTTFSELVRISGLSHGTDVWLNNAQELINQNIASLSQCICCRDDIMIYLINMGLSTKTAFKIMEDVRKGKGVNEEYEAAMKEKGVPDWYIESCKKIKYMFPKAHAAAYVMMAFRIAWFKVYYPEAFYVAYFTVRADDFDAKLMTVGQEKIRNKIYELEKKGNDISQKEKNILTVLEVANEMYARGIQFLAVDLYESDAVKFKITKNGIRPPLIGLQGLGTAAAQSIVEARKNGAFLSVDDLRFRAKVSKAVIEILQDYGCLKGMPESSQISLF